MSKTTKPPKSRDAIPKLSQSPAPAAAPAAPWFRETVESIVIAFVLAFLFRTFEAEAFVIPTGSMAPTLMGRHKDVYCPQCGHRYQVGASEEENEEVQANPARAVSNEIVAGMCPVCRYTMPMRSNLPKDELAEVSSNDVSNQSSYNGDRILVNKYIYTLGDPKRWDVVVFHFPGDAEMNYIKRLVGLPGETLRIYQGDLFTKPTDNAGKSDFQIEHKPAAKVLAMRQLVHDTDYDPSSLYTAGWPLRWSGGSANGGWEASADASGQKVRQRFSVDSADEDTKWIRYRNFVPDYRIWQELAVAERRAQEQGGGSPKLSDEGRDRSQPQLVMDFNAYNTRVTRGQAMQFGSLAPPPGRTGIHWVGDLMLVADVDVEASRGELVLDLVEGGRHFTCTIELSNGQAKLAAEGQAGYGPTAKTMVSAPGSYRIGLANFDDQLLLFVKKKSLLMGEFGPGDAVAFDGGTAYDVAEVFGDRSRIVPKTSPEDPGDLAPAGVGARAKLAVTRLQMWRDIYYIAESWRDHQYNMPITDFKNLTEQMINELAFNQSLWPNFLNRRQEEFTLGTDQFFVMGDNSPESSDARLWCTESSRGVPGGAYLERRLLIGKALCVYWPHSWNRIPGTPIPFPLFPNFEDMRLVR